MRHRDGAVTKRLSAYLATRERHTPRLLPDYTHYIYTGPRDYYYSSSSSHTNIPFSSNSTRRGEGDEIGHFNHDYWLRGLIMISSFFFFTIEIQNFSTGDPPTDGRVHTNSTPERHADGRRWLFPSLERTLVTLMGWGLSILGRLGNTSSCLWAFLHGSAAFLLLRKSLLCFVFFFFVSER